MNVAKLRYEIDSSQTVKAKDNLKAQTRASKDAQKAQQGLGSVSTKAGRDIKAANDNISRSSQIAARGFNAMKVAGLAAFVGILGAATGAVKALRKFLDATVESDKGQAQLAATIKSTGGAAQQSVASLNAHAAALQQVTIFGDEYINRAQGILLTFTQISGDAFPRATQAVLDMSTALKVDLQAASLQVGKALNDPVLGMSALSRAGIQFTQAQKDMAKEMVAVGNIAGAQNIVFAELEKQFGGSAAAARGTLGGALAALKNAFGDLFELTGPASERLRASVEALVATISDPRFMQSVQNIGAALFDVFGSGVQFVANYGDTIATTFRRIILGASGVRTDLVFMSETVGIAFSQVPKSVAEYTISAMNSMIKSIENGLNSVIDKMNTVISGANNLAGIDAFEELKGFGIARISRVDIGRIQNDYAGAGQAAAKAFSDAQLKYRQSTTIAQNKFLGDSLDLDAASRGGSGFKGVVSELGEIAPAATRAGQAAQKAGSSISKGGRAAQDSWKNLRSTVDTASTQIQEAGSNLGQSLGGIFKGLIDGTKSWKDAALSAVQSVISYLAKSNGGGLSGGGRSGGGFLSSLLSSFLSFDGGGDTGSGPRSGGLDGKGGYMAMVHPQETIIDRTKGGGAVAANNNAASQPQVIDINITGYLAERNGEISTAFNKKIRTGMQQASGDAVQKVKNSFGEMQSQSQAYGRPA